jgi:hypothetical protein
MGAITLSMPEELRKEMGEFPEINWSAVAREAIKRRILLLKEMNELLKDSRLTEEDTIRLGKELNKRVAKKLLRR